MSDLKKCLIYLEQNSFQSSLGLLEVARQIYSTEAYKTYGVTFGPMNNQMNGCLDALVGVDNENLKPYDIRNMTNVLEELQKTYLFDSILFPATQYGRMLAPSLAMRLHSGLVADVTGIQHTKETVEMVRPTFGGKLMARIVMKNRPPLMMSVNPNAFEYRETDLKKTEMIEYNPKLYIKSGIEFLENRPKESEDIRDSEILVSGGGGVMRNFALLKELADLMNAQVSASRKTVDSGIAPRSIQVGQSGKTVSPRLYMAMGINGSIQHIEGLKNVETIISVNTNKNAPIFSISDIAVVGDAKEFIVKLIDKIKANNGSIN